MSDVDSIIRALRGNFGTMSPAEDAEIPLNPFEEAHKKAFGNFVEAPYHVAKSIGGMVDAARTAPPPGLRREDYSEDPNAPQPSQGLTDATLEAVTNLVGPGMAGAQPGSAGMFGGKMALGSDLQKLFKAEDMAADGWAKQKILGETGWFQHPVDNKWRFEISDKNMQFKSPINLAGEEGQYAKARMSDFVDHPELFEHYPDFKDRELHLTSGPRGGWFMPTPDNNAFHIEVTAPNVRDATAVGLHELQHGVQQREGFGRGSSAREFASLLEKDLRDRGGPLKSADFMDAAKRADNAYWNTSGEVEARNTVIRQNLSPEVRRRYILPWETQEVPYAKQLLMEAGPDAILRALRSK